MPNVGNVLILFFSAGPEQFTLFKKGEADMFEKFEKKFGEGTVFDLDYGKLLIIGLLIYHIFFQKFP